MSQYFHSRTNLLKILTFWLELNNDMKSFVVNQWMLQQPLLINGIYNEDGNPNAKNACMELPVESW